MYKNMYKDLAISYAFSKCIPDGIHYWGYSRKQLTYQQGTYTGCLPCCISEEQKTPSAVFIQ